MWVGLAVREKYTKEFLVSNWNVTGSELVEGIVNTGFDTSGVDP